MNSSQLETLHTHVPKIISLCKFFNPHFLNAEFECKIYAYSKILTFYNKSLYTLALKTPRKTIESWMLKVGIPEIEIYSRQGHDPITSLRHYQSLSFTDYEIRDIERLTEWGIFRKEV
jgi:hypothetical protein